MFRELIDKLKLKRQQLQKYNTNDNITETKPIKEEKEIDIKVSKQGNIYKIEISDYISIIDFVDKKNYFNILNQLKSIESVGLLKPGAVRGLTIGNKIQINPEQHIQHKNYYTERNVKVKNLKPISH